MKKLTLIILFCAAGLPNSFSQWIHHPISHDTGGQPTTLGDCDNDGDNDLISFNGLNYQVEILENLDQGNFAAAELPVFTFTDAGDTNFLAPQIKFSDLNGDGLGDLIVQYFSDSSLDKTIGWIENLGSLNFGNFQFLYAYGDIAPFNINANYSTPVGDFDADGDIDIALLDLVGATNQIKLLENDGTGSFTLFSLGYTTTTMNFYPVIFAADKDHDADTDLIFETIWFENTGSGWVQHDFSYIEFSSEVFTPNDYDSFFSDFNNDGFTDLINADVYAGEEVFYMTLGDATGDYTQANTIMLPANVIGMEISRYDFVDMNGDGDIDVFAFHDDYAELGFGWYENLGNGTFSLFNELFFMTYDNGLSVVEFFFEDLTDDGLADIFISSTHEVKDAYMTNLGAGSFDSFRSIRNTDWPVRITSADFTGDGKNEVITTSFENLTLSVYHHYDQGVFGNHKVLFPFINDFHYAFILDSLDFDNDCDLDLLIAFSGGAYESNLGFYQNNSGNMETYVPLDDSLDNVYEMEVVDFDLDGFNDIVVVTGIADSINAVVLFTNNGSGQFLRDTLLIETLIAGSFLDIANVDINSDGWMDFILTGTQDDYVHWYENDGTGGFIDHIVYPTIPILTDAGSARADYADFNNDGFVDIVASYIEGTIYVYLNDGTGTFTTEILVVPGNASNYFDHADFDNDGDEDILASAYTDGFMWYVNDGTAAFGSTVLVSVYEHSIFCLDDLNDDGHVDIIAGGGPGNVEKTVLWYEGGTSMATIYEQPYSTSLLLFPNPASNVVNIVPDQYTASAHESVIIYSIAGQPVFRQTLQEGTTTLTVPVDNLANGVYTAFIRNASGTVASSQFVVQH